MVANVMSARTHESSQTMKQSETIIAARSYPYKLPRSKRQAETPRDAVQAP